MHHILSIERTSLTGTSTTHLLHQVSPGVYRAVVDGVDGTPRDIRADSAHEAVARSAPLRQIDGSDATRITVNDSAINRNDLLDILRPTADAVDLYSVEADGESDYDAFASWPHDLETATQRWATWHRIEIDGVAVYGVDMGQGKVVLVDGDSPDRPFDGWTELLALAWDSSGYSAVGMAGYGIDGLYLVRPGLLATVHYDDENLELSLERVSRRASAFSLMRSRATRIVYSDRHIAQLTLSTYGIDPEAVYASDSMSSVLDVGDLHRLLRRIHLT